MNLQVGWRKASKVSGLGVGGMWEPGVGRSFGATSFERFACAGTSTDPGPFDLFPCWVPLRFRVLVIWFKALLRPLKREPQPNPGEVGLGFRFRVPA